MKVYTKTGDKGTTSLVGGQRVPKNHPRIEAYGTVDELSAQTAYLRDNLPDTSGFAHHKETLLSILDHLMRLSSHLATEGDACKYLPVFGTEQVAFLEREIDAIQASLRPIDKFTLPGGHPAVSLSHICRTVCRRSERRILSMSTEYPVEEHIISYINRLSDYFYVLGRKLSDEFGAKESYWIYDK